MNKPSAPKLSARWFQKEKRGDSTKIPPKSKGASEKNWLDNCLEKSAYYIIFGLWVLGSIILLVLVVRLFLPWNFLETWEILKKEETARNIYYLLIFVGAGLAATLATWRGRQSERQINRFEQQLENSRLERQSARFEKGIDMATDPSEARRGSGFRILQQMLSSWRENFDASKESDIDILNHLVFDSFARTKKQEEAFIKLYKDSKISFSTAEIMVSKNLFHEVQEPSINVPSLKLWNGIVNWNRKKWSNPSVVGIYAAESNPSKSHRFIFSGVSFGYLDFFVMGSDGKIISSTQHVMAGFRGSCFFQVEMHGATADYVDFSESHFSKVNCAEKSKEDCEMSCIGANFTEVNLIECNFRGANFKGASFLGITALIANFDEANLTDCKFDGADLGGASFVEANISRVDFRQVKKINEGQFEKAYWIFPGKPKFPEGYDIDVEELMRLPPGSEE